MQTYITEDTNGGISGSAEEIYQYLKGIESSIEGYTNIEFNYIQDDYGLVSIEVYGTPKNLDAVDMDITAQIKDSILRMDIE